MNSVLRTGERDAAVHDEDLAVVTQVGALPLELPRFERQHEAPLHTRVVEHFHELLIGRVFAGADVVDEYAHLYTAFVGGEESVPEDCARLVVGGDVELEVHVFGGAVDFFRHGDHRVVVVGVEGELVAADQGERAEGVVELAGYLCRVGEIIGAGEEGFVFADIANHVVHGVLACAAVGGQARGAEDEECDEPYEGDEEDCHEPAQCNHGFAVVGEPEERCESDEDIGDAECEAQPVGQEVEVGGGKQVHPSIMPVFRVGFGGVGLLLRM